MNLVLMMETNREKKMGKKVTPESTEPVIEYVNADIERADRLVLKNIDFKVNPGEFFYLVGKVGSGKSSLLKSMYADVSIPKADKAMVQGFDLMKLKRKQIPHLRRRIGIVFQDFQLLQDRSALANLKFVLESTGWKSRTEIEERIEEVLKAVGMTNKAYKMPHELSGGEQQRIVIARALLNHPSLILADEPTGNLDPDTGSQIIKLLHDLSGNGTAVVMATHNLQMVEEYPGLVLRCEDKALIPG